MKKMPQVAARLTPEQENWLQSNFRTKGAGAEFLLAWTAESFTRCLSACRELFSDPELKTVVMAHKDTRLLPEHTRTAFLAMRVEDACAVRMAHTQFAASRTTLEAKLKKLDDTQAAALSIWAAAFWNSRAVQGNSLDEYVKQI